jgi:hypothetical protein
MTKVEATKTVKKSKKTTTKSTCSYTIATGRYNNATYEESLAYRGKKKITCIYAPACPLSQSIPRDSPVFIIEMNNQRNMIMGIGLIKNKLQTDRNYKVHSDTNLNRYIYIGRHHLPRERLQLYSPNLVSVLDEILFKGKTHSKRGIGLLRIPESVLQSDLCEGLDLKKEIRNVFAHHYKVKAEPK